MSLRTRLFLALSGLVAALVVGQWWLMTSLSRELDRELDTVALAVSGSVASFFSYDENGGHVVMDADHVSDRLAHDARMAQLPDPSELVEFIETGDARDRLQTVVIRREFDLDSEIPAEGSDIQITPNVRWKVETLEEKDGRFEYTFRHDGSAEDAVGGDDAAGTGVKSVGGPRRVVHQYFVPDEAALQEGGVVLHTDDGVPDPNGEQANVRIHIERSPKARFLWLVGPESQARVPLPEAGLNEKIDDFRRRMLLGSGLVLFLGLLLSAALAHRVSAPLRRLAAAAEEVGGGALGTQVDESAGDREVASTLGAFNRMSSRLAELDARARKLSALRHLGEIGDVARGLAHTLRNPLNALGLTVEELASRAADSDDASGEGDASESLVSSARRQIQRMDRGIRSFLVLASPSGSAAEPVDVSRLARDVALEALQDGGGRVRVSVDATTAPELDGVEAELRAVLQALVVNAVEASAAGSEVEVRVESLEREGESDSGAHGVRIEVCDRGPGLPEEIRKRLFTPHVSTKANGSGMGLFLAHRLATERYGGSLELRDRDPGDDEGGGTVAVLELGDRVDPEDPDASSGEAS